MFQNIIVHLQDMPNHTLKFICFKFLLKSDKTVAENVIFDPFLTTIIGDIEN